tara:strand:+ start:2011 stop:3798 length:1788 start_codon:yes stop_codon:yes gene_type:complete
MAADPTLTKALFTEASTRAASNAQNQKPLYDSSLDIMKTGQTFIDELMAQTYKRNQIDRLAKEKQMSGFDKIADDTYLSLYEMDEPMPDKVVNALRTRIKDLKEEFELVNTYGKNDTEENNNARIRLLGELKRITSSTIKTRENFMTMSKEYPDWNNARIKTEDIETLKSFLNLKNMDMDDNISVVYTSEGLTFVNAATGRSFTAAQMREAMPIVDTAPQVLGNNRGVSAQSSAKQHVTDGATGWYDKKDVNLYNQRKTTSADALLETIKTDDEFVNAATIPLMQGTQSLEDALTGHKAISTDVIKNMYIDERTGELIPMAETFLRWDRDGDGDVDSADVSKIPESEREAFIANHKEMVKAIVRPDHPAYNKEASRKILGSYFADLEEQAYNNQFNYSFEQKNKGNENVFDFNVNTGYTMQMADGTDKYVSGQLIKTMQNFIDNPVEGSTIQAYDGNLYSYKDGKFYMGDDLVTQSRISKNLGMWSYGYAPKDTYKGPLPPPDDPEEATGVPYPKRSITSSDFNPASASSEQVLYDLEQTYKDYPGFKFENSSSSLLVTAPDGTEKYIVMNRTLRGNKESRDQIQAFIAKYANTK